MDYYNFNTNAIIPSASFGSLVEYQTLYSIYSYTYNVLYSCPLLLKPAISIQKSCVALTFKWTTVKVYVGYANHATHTHIVKYELYDKLYDDLYEVNI